MWRKGSNQGKASVNSRALAPTDPVPDARRPAPAALGLALLEAIIGYEWLLRHRRA
jgi:hypothetical protein